MTKQELTFTGKYFDVTPVCWGESYIIGDYDSAIEAMKQSFGDDEDFSEDTPDTEIELATDKEGNFYAVDGEYFAKCDNPETAEDGLAYIGKFELFDE